MPTNSPRHGVPGASPSSNVSGEGESPPETAWSAQEWRDLLTGPAEGAAQALEQAAQDGMALAQLYYGQFLLDGRGVAVDQRAALEWFHKAAQAGLPMAMNMVGRCLDQGHGTPEDPEQAVVWFRAAAERGLDWGLYNLATMLSIGRGVVEDKAQALELFRQAALQGHAKSTNMVGLFHEEGWSVPRSDLLAAYHFARAAEGGDCRGAFNHARMLIAAGQVDEALVWLEKARTGGHDRFRDQMAEWLAARGEEPLRALAAQWGWQTQ